MCVYRISYVMCIYIYISHYISRFPLFLPHQLLLPAFDQASAQELQTEASQKKATAVRGPKAATVVGNGHVMGNMMIDHWIGGVPQKFSQSLVYNPLIYPRFNVEFVLFCCRRLFSLVVVASFLSSFLKGFLANHHGRVAFLATFWAFATVGFCTMLPMGLVL